VLQGVETIPGVRAAALGDCIPGRSAPAATLVFGDRSNDPAHPAPAKGCWISSGFFSVAGTPLLRGRFFNSGDSADAALVAIVNQQAARAYWPGQNPIGKFIGVNYTGPGRVGKSSPAMRRIVGVVEGMKHSGLEAPTEPAVYMPYLQDETFHDMATMHLFVRSTGSPALLESAIRDRIHAVRADQPVDTISTMDDMVAQAMAPRRYSLSLLAAFAALTLLLAAVGIYGVVSYATQQRTSEFGIRIAVGAARSHVMALVFRHGLRLAGTGCAIGFGVALVAAHALERLLFEIGPFDSVSFAAAAVVLGLVAGAACALPALRAARVDPVRALRHP
jgi:putative ABC transport system permease protein